MDSISEKEILLACQGGSEVAFKKLVELYYRDAYAMALFRTRNREVALDISQEAFIRIFRNIKKFDFKHSFKAWLYTIVKNLSLNYLERRRKRWTVFSDFFTMQGTPHEPVDDPPEAIDREDTRQQVWKSLHRLKQQDRDIILLKDFENYSYQEISELLGIPLGTVMSRLFHARKKLGTLLREYENVR